MVTIRTSGLYLAKWKNYYYTISLINYFWRACIDELEYLSTLNSESTGVRSETVSTESGVHVRRSDMVSPVSTTTEGTAKRVPTFEYGCHGN